MAVWFVLEPQSIPRRLGKSTARAKGGACRWGESHFCVEETMAVNGIDDTAARKIVRALRKGATPTEYADKLFVGYGDWFKTAVQMMRHTAEDNDFEVRFLRAAYGGGKTMFL